MDPLKDKAILNAGMSAIKSESGLFLDPVSIAEKNSRHKADVNAEYDKKRQALLDAPAPNIVVPFSNVLTRAVTPKRKVVKGFEGSMLIHDEFEIEDNYAEQLKNMSNNVVDEQEILLVGPHVISNGNYKPGMIAKINFARYRQLKEDTPGIIETYYNIPAYTIDGNKYIIIDERDILYAWPEGTRDLNETEEE